MSDHIANRIGGDDNDLGYFATPEALEDAYPIGFPGAFASVGSTATIWIWDQNTTAWIDSHVPIATGPTGPTGPRGATGATGPTGPIFYTAETYSDALLLASGSQPFQVFVAVSEQFNNSPVMYIYDGINTGKLSQIASLLI